MKTIALTVSAALAAFGLLGMMRGPLPSGGTDARDGEGLPRCSASPRAGSVSVVSAALRVTAVAAAECRSQHASTITAPVAPPPTATPVPDWTPTPQPGLSRALVPGEAYKAPPVAALRALARVSPERELDAIRIGYCESGWDAAAQIIDVDGLPRQGAFQVGATWHGPVPADLAGQAEQFERIAAAHGLWPWTTRAGCARWEGR